MTNTTKQYLNPVLIFDLAETLIGGLFWMVAPAAELLGVTEDDIREAFGGNHLNQLFKGRLSEESYWNIILEQTGWQSTPEELGELARDSFKKTVPGMKSLLSRLQNYTCALLTDHAREWIEFIDQKHDFLHNLDYRFHSFDLQMTKHSPQIFQFVAEKLGRRPQDCLFIDDLADNTARAASVGFQTIHFENAHQLEFELTNLGIKFCDRIQ